MQLHYSMFQRLGLFKMKINCEMLRYTILEHRQSWGGWGPSHYPLLSHLFEWHCVSFSVLAVFSRNALNKSTFYFYLLTNITIAHYHESIPNIWNGTMFGNLDWPLNTSRGLSAIAESLVVFLGISVLDLGPMYATVRQTDRQTDKQTDRHTSVARRRQTDVRRALSLNAPNSTAGAINSCFCARTVTVTTLP